MKIIANELKDVLSKLNSVLTNNSVIEGSDKFVFEKDFVYVFNGQVFARVDFESGINGAIQGLSLIKYLDKIGGAEIEIEQNEDKVDIKKGRAVASFVLDTANEIPVQVETIDWKKVPENFTDALIFCANSYCFERGQDYSDMRTMVVHVKDSYCESTDRQRIVRYNMSKKMKDELFIPFDLIAHLGKGKITEYSYNDEWLFFKNQSGDIICGRKVAFGEDYFDLDSIISKNEEEEEIEFPEKMYDSIEKAAVFQNDIRVDADRKIKIRCKKGKIKVQSDGTYGNFSEVMKTSVEKDFSFIINPMFLSQIIEKSNTVFFHPDYIRIETDNYVFLTTLAAE